MLEIIYIWFINLCKIYAIYFIFISIFSIFGKKKGKETNKKLRFAVLIAARNEENCISGIVDSLKHQEYPEELIDVFVIPNHCTDNTAEVAKTAGAYVMEAPKNVNYKGDALRFATDKLLKSDKQYDAFLVFDADNEACPEFVSSMNKTLCNGSRVAKSRIFAKNREDSWVAMCYDIHFCTANLFLNRARVRIGLSARLVGTGFAVTSDFLREIDGFKTETITEDAEFFAICAARGEKIGFCEDAITYDEQSLGFMTSLIQRKRWMSGIMQVLVLKFNDLIRGLFRKESAKYSLDTLIQFTFAYIQAVIPFVLLVGIIDRPMAFIHSLPMTILTGYIYILSTALIVLFFEKRLKFSRNVIAGILLYPLFVISFIPLQTVSLFKKTVDWKETEHTGVRMYGEKSNKKNHHKKNRSTIIK
jgi:cellulose synthase/poly-beta-1,6-N-acetylglucosamine synthase-like glycosyltransferase